VRSEEGARPEVSRDGRAPDDGGRPSGVKGRQHPTVPTCSHATGVDPCILRCKRSCTLRAIFRPLRPVLVAAFAPLG
jgi:hypothetical protein